MPFHPDFERFVAPARRRPALWRLVLGCLLIYLPFLNTVFGTRPLHILHWFPGVPFSILILVYDEVRKLLMRGSPGGWLERFTYW